MKPREAYVLFEAPQQGRPTACTASWPFRWHKTVEQADRSQSHPLTGRSNRRVA